MGFKIAVNYDGSILKPKGIASGTVTQNGLLNDSISVSEEGYFDVVWSATEDSDIDGTLFTINFEVLKENNSEIKFSFSQSDTFDEDWNDVYIDCQNMIVSFSPNSQEVTSKTEVRAATEKDIILAVESVSQESENYLSEVNEHIFMITGTQNMFIDKEEVENAYSAAIVQNFITSVQESVDGSKIDTVITDSLETFNCKAIEELPDGSKEGFVRKVESDLSDISPDIYSISEKIGVDKSIEAINKLNNENVEHLTSGVSVPKEKELAPLQSKNSAKPIIVTSVILLLCLTLMIIKIVKGRKENEENS